MHSTYRSYTLMIHILKSNNPFKAADKSINCCFILKEENKDILSKVVLGIIVLGRVILERNILGIVVLKNVIGLSYRDVCSKKCPSGNNHFFEVTLFMGNVHVWECYLTTVDHEINRTIILCISQNNETLKNLHTIKNYFKKSKCNFSH